MGFSGLRVTPLGSYSTKCVQDPTGVGDADLAGPGKIFSIIYIGKETIYLNSNEGLIHRIENGPTEFQAFLAVPTTDALGESWKENCVFHDCAEI